MIKQTTTGNPKTGEIYSVKKEVFSDSMNEEGYRFPSHKLGARMFSDIQFPKEITHAEIGKMTVLARSMIAKTNMLGYRNGSNILPYNIEEIGAKVGLYNKRCSKEFVWRMCQLGLMRRVDSVNGSFYYINPAYFMANGQRLSLELFILFQNELKILLPQWAIVHFLNQVRENEANKQTASV